MATKDTGNGRNTTMRKATRDEKKAFRAVGGRKVVKQGGLPEIYSAEKGGRLVTSKNSGTTASRTNTKSMTGKKSTADSGLGMTAPGAGKKKTIAEIENASFYGDTKKGQRLVKRATRVNPGVATSTGFIKTPLKKKK
jgi:hypothetical protein